MARSRALLFAALALALAACKRAAPEGDGRGAIEGAVTGKGGPPPLAEKPFFRLEAAPQPPCTAGAPCEVKLVLHALGDYHINDQYPFKLVADASPELSVEGTGTWTRDADQRGTLAVVVRSAKPGTATLAGTFKLSVCTDENCEIETPKIALPVTTSP